jgi:uncharacterized protein YqfA (UPF0365 family)
MGEFGGPMALVGMVVLVVLFFMLLWLIPVRLWIEARTARVKIGLFHLIMMRLRKVPPTIIVRPLIASTQADLELSAYDLESHYLAGGNPLKVVRALITADRAKLHLEFGQACAIDLAGRDVLEAVQMSVKPKVIDAPDPQMSGGKQTVEAVAGDGIQLKAKARITVRTNLPRLIGGATEETIIARVGEGIVTTIGSCASHKEVLENPDIISKTLLEKGLDSETAFEIVSIDIADVDVGDNIGAKLQIDQADADKQIAQAKAEERKAMALALEQEMVARVQEMRARVVEAEAEVPKAMAEAFRSGNMGIMDYYNMKNVISDTDMRGNIAKSQKPEDQRE